MFVDDTVSSIPILVGVQMQPVIAAAITVGADVDDENRLNDAEAVELLPEQSQPGELYGEIKIE